MNFRIICKDITQTTSVKYFQLKLVSKCLTIRNDYVNDAFFTLYISRYLGQDYS